RSPSPSMSAPVIANGAVTIGAVLLLVAGQAALDVEPRERAVVADEAAREAVRARTLRVTRVAELDDVALRAARAIRDRLGAVVELAPGDAVIRRAHRLVALVARLALVARHLRVARGASRRVALGRLGVIAAEREGVVERALGGGQVVARCERGDPRGAL